MRTITNKALDIIYKGSKKDRYYLCKNDPALFNLYYFSQFFTFDVAPFHYDFYDDIEKLVNGDLDEVAWIAFRESAKTSIAKTALLCWAICYKKKEYINFDSYDKSNSESALFDVVVALQSNKRIIDDFGHLYHLKRAKDALVEAKLKRINNFITENNVRVEAFSTQEPTRGRVYGHIRPQMFILDDIENNKTKESYAITKKIKDHIDEMKSGLGPGACVLYLGNLITEEGVIAEIMEKLKNNPRAMVRNIPVVDDHGKIAWTDKYVKTDAEATEINKTIKNKEIRKISLESKLRTLGKAVYQTEMMNDPGASEDYFFDREFVKGLIKDLTENPREPIHDLAGFKVWHEYKPNHSYGGGADTSEGIGADANASVIIDYSTRPARVASTYENNDIPPNVFAWEIKREGNYFGGCFFIPEINNTGYATVSELQTSDCNYLNIYQREQKHKITGRMMKEYGWRTTSGTKYDLMGNLKSAIEDGQLEVLDLSLLKEIYHYRKQDLRLLKVEEGMTKHFDKLMALALAWEARKWVTVGVDKNIYKSRQKPYEG